MANVFSIDYRSPPSGLGQIFDPTRPDTPENMILVSYDGNGNPNNPQYGGQIHLKNIYEIDLKNEELNIELIEEEILAKIALLRINNY